MTQTLTDSLATHRESAQCDWQQEAEALREIVKTQSTELTQLRKDLARYRYSCAACGVPSFEKVQRCDCTEGIDY